MKIIKAIELQFENCEGLRLGINVFGYVYLGKIKTEIVRIACNAIVEQDFANEIALEIYSEAEKLGEWVPSWSNYAPKLRRIMDYNDITHIRILYEDGTEHTYQVDYREESEALGAPNLNQNTYLSSLGNLYITISKDNNIEDYFPRKYTEDVELVEFNKKMYDIGV